MLRWSNRNRPFFNKRDFRRKFFQKTANATLGPNANFGKQPGEPAARHTPNSMKKLTQYLPSAGLFGMLATLFLVVGCGGPKKATYATDELVPKEKALLWRISGNGLKKPSHLFGTIHLIPKSEFELSAATQAALRSAGRVAFEIDMREMTNLRTQFSLISKAFMAGGKTLRDLLPAEDYEFVHSKLAEKGLPPTMLERLKPMFLSTMFGSESEDGGGIMPGGGNTTSVEMEIYGIAKKQKKETAGLETAAYQMAIFDSIPYTEQAKMLVESLRSTDGGSDEFAKMVELYRSQDIGAMVTMMNEEGAGIKNYEHLLLTKRNENWVAPMGRMMREKPTFFAVGAGHLGGPNGVIALLRKQGYRVEAVLP